MAEILLLMLNNMLLTLVVAVIKKVKFTLTVGRLLVKQQVSGVIMIMLLLMVEVLSLR